MNYGVPNTYGSVAYASPDVRADFIRKVYSLFFTSILVTVGVGAYCASPTVAPAVLPMVGILGIAGFLVVIGLFFARRVNGLNTALFYLYSAIQGAILGAVLMMVDRAAPGVPTAAATLTIGVFGGLSLYAIQSKKDFSYLGGMLFAGLIGLFVMGLVLMFFHIPFLSMLYAFGGVLIFSGYVLYDTSMIMQRLGPDEAIVGAISLYLDLLNLFWFILQILMEFNRRD